MLIELLAAVAADPTHIPLWIVAAFAAGMYPIGFMLGAPCSPCCGKCSNCQEGTLPETVTVTLNGFTDKSPGPFLCGLTFSACYGSGAAGRVTAPAGDPDTDAGPVSAVSLTNAGSGYAKLGRVIPTVTATGSGSGASFDVTLTQSQDNCDLDFWAVSGVKITGSGTGYAEDEILQFSVAEGDTEQVVAVVRLQTQREEPTATLAVSSSSGTGAELSVSFASIGGTPEQWEVSAVTVDDAGDLYATGDEVAFTFGTNTLEVGPASFFVKAAHVEPSVEALMNYTAGTGAAFAVTLSPFVSFDGSDVWAVDSISVTNAGSGYAQYDPVEVVAVDGITRAGCGAYVDAVDENGEILSVSVYDGGEYLKGGPITEVEVTNGGTYYGDSGEPIGVEIDNGGIYYREDASAPPYVADITVGIDQLPPSAGAGAEISATVGDDPEDAATFGKITALTIDAAGDDYLAWRWLANDCCGHALNGKQYVLKRSLGTPGGATLIGGLAGAFVANECVYSHAICGGWNSPFLAGPYWALRMQYASHRIEVGYRGPTIPPVAGIRRGGPIPSDEANATSACTTFFAATSLVTDCSAFSFSATQANGRTISVSPGGDYDAEATNPGGQGAGCSACCQGAGIPPQEITVQVQDLRPFAPINITGQHVLTKWNGNYQIWTIDIPGAGPYGNSLQIRVQLSAFLCASQQEDGGCDNCIKKCAVLADVFYGDGGSSDTRTCNLSESQVCAAICLDNPMCAPPAGVQIGLGRNGPCGNADFIITT